jgi:hypothetical protein
MTRAAEDEDQEPTPATGSRRGTPGELLARGWPREIEWQTREINKTSGIVA